MNKSKVLVCSAWPYASGLPHLGNLVSSLLSGDVFARYYRLRGHDVLYVSGTDAHGTRIEYEARQLGISPEELAAKDLSLSGLAVSRSRKLLSQWLSAASFPSGEIATVKMCEPPRWMTRCS